MPRANRGPRLELYGPDTRYGAKRRPGFKQYRWYIVWSERGIKREQPTGVAAAGRAPDRGPADRALSAFLEERAELAKPIRGPRRPDQMMVADALAYYGREHAPNVADPKRIGYAIKALLPYWENQTVDAITGNTCRRYLAERRQQFAEQEAERIEGVRIRYAARKIAKTPKPARILKDDTVRRELVTLAAALKHCVTEGYLTAAPLVWLPEKGRARERALSRDDVAKLLREARKSHRGRLHLPLFILIAFYTGARRTAILQLQWQPNLQGGWVDLERGVIDFRGPRQTKKRRVPIPIPHRLMTFLRHARKRTRQYVIEFEARRYEDPKTGEIVIERRPIKDPKKALGTAGEKAGLGHVFTHLLKHSAISFLASRRVPIADIVEWTGTSEETVKAVYRHVDPEYFRSVQEALR